MDKDFFKDVKAVGFDLDGTLYKATEEIDDRIGEHVAAKILEKSSEFKSIEEAKTFYKKRYKEIESGSKTLMEVGYEPIEAREVMKKCLDESDISDLLQKDEELVNILEQISKKYFIYLITKSPADIGRKKLASIGIDESIFKYKVYGDNIWFIGKTKKEALTRVFEESSIPPDQHVYVGDRRNDDIINAKLLGVKTIAVWSRIEEADATALHIHDIKELLL